MKRVVTFGEIMGRICPDGFRKFRQSLPGTLNWTFAGAEANVAVSLSLLGHSAAFVTALPRNEIADTCIGTLNGLGVDTSHIIRTDEGRLGLYFVETGANQRPSKVIYDRSGASVAVVNPEVYDWDAAFKNADWFHTTGITPALSQYAANAVLMAVEKAKTMGLTVSCDLNFRKKLWQWDTSKSPGELAQTIMTNILPYVDVVIANEEDAADVLNIQAGKTDVHSGHLDIKKYPMVARKIIEKFSNVKRVAITLRESLSATHNSWGAMLYEKERNEAFFAPVDQGNYNPYQIKNIVDRVGGGDSFAAGLIYALTSDEFQKPQLAVSFAASSSCLAHSISGDFNFSTKEDILLLMRGSGSGRVIR